MIKNIGIRPATKNRYNTTKSSPIKPPTISVTSKKKEKITSTDSLSNAGSFKFSFEMFGTPIRSNKMGEVLFDVLKSNINNIKFAYPKNASENDIPNSNLRKILKKIL